MKYYGKRGIIFLLLVLLLIFHAYGLEIEPALEKELNTKGYADVIVFVKAPLQPATQELLSKEIDSTTLQKILREKKAAIKRQQSNVLRELDIGTSLQSDIDLVLDEKYTYINGFSGILTKEGFEKIKYDDAIIGIYANEQVSITLDTATPFIGADFAETISFNNTQINGSGIGICVIDTGVDATHPSLQGKIVGQYCYCSQGTGCCPNNLTEDTSAEDDHGHGTGVIGTIVSQEPFLRGAAPGAHVMAVKALNNIGRGTMSDVIAGIGKCLEKAAEYNIKIFSFSFGGTTYPGTCDEDALASVANELVDMGFVVVAASGNNGDATHISTPACGTNVTSAGAVYDNSSTTPDTVVYFSNANPTLDILAPGFAICTTKAEHATENICYTAANSGMYNTYSGTSFSTPLVAGAAAVIAQYKQHESQSIEPAGIIHDLKQYGQPVLDARNGLVFPRLDIENTLRHIDSSAPIITITETNISKHFTISAEVSDAVNDIVLCKFSADGINETMNMTGNGREATCTIEKEFTNTTTYNVYSIDNNSNIAYSEHTIIVTNNAPVINTYSPDTTTLSLQNTENLTFYINASDADGDSINYEWILNGTFVGNEQTYNFSASEGAYILEGVARDGTTNASIQWSIEVRELAEPYISSVHIMPNPAYRNENLTCNYTYFDAYGEPENGTIIGWHLNDIFSRNATEISKEELHVGDTWNCSVTANDGIFFSNTTYSPAIIIENYAPEISAEDVTVPLPAQIVITYTVSDADNDTVAVSINDSRFEDFVMNTTTAESFDVLLSANDGYYTTNTTIHIIVYDNETDTDSDGVLDSTDKINGSITGFTTLVNDEPVTNNTLTEEALVSFTHNNDRVVSFIFDFTTDILDLTDAEITIEETGNGNILIKGLDIESKTAYIDAINSSAHSVCVQDVEEPTNITAYCTGAHETFVPCNGTTIDGYTCTAFSDRYMITGLKHSAVQQQCIDTDGDGYGLGCTAGNDCNDENSAVFPTATEIYDNSIDDNCDGVSATTLTTPVRPIPATSAAGGGGSAGPDISKEEAKETEITTEEESEVFESTISSSSEEIEKPVFLEETLVEATGLADITGAAISDASAGKLTLNVLGLIAVTAVGCSLLFGSGYYAIKHKKIHEKIDFFNPKEGITIIYQGMRDLFKK